MKYCTISKKTRVIFQIQSIASIIMTSPSANQEATIASEKDNPPVGIVEETLDTPYGSIHGERFEPRNIFLEELSATENFDKPTEPAPATENLDCPIDPTLDLDLEQTDMLTENLDLDTPI